MWTHCWVERFILTITTASLRLQNVEAGISWQSLQQQENSPSNLVRQECWSAISFVSVQRQLISKHWVLENKMIYKPGKPRSSKLWLLLIRPRLYSLSSKISVIFILSSSEDWRSGIRTVLTMEMNCQQSDIVSYWIAWIKFKSQARLQVGSTSFNLSSPEKYENKSRLDPVGGLESPWNSIQWLSVLSLQCLFSDIFGSCLKFPKPCTQHHDQLGNFLIPFGIIGISQDQPRVVKMAE